MFGLYVFVPLGGWTISSSTPKFLARERNPPFLPQEGQGSLSTHNTAVFADPILQPFIAFWVASASACVLVMALTFSKVISVLGFWSPLFTP